MKNPLYLTIGQMAELNHVSAQTLRLYDKEGLLHPEVQDPENGYRYYHINQCAQLDLIHTMKLCGMTLRQIRQQMNNGSAQEWYALLQEQDRMLEQKQKQLSDSRKSVHRLCAALRQLSALPPMGEIFLENIPERRIDTLPTEYDSLADGYTGYERMLRLLKGHMVRQELPLSYFLNAGTLIERNDFEQERYVAHTVFIFVDEDYPEVGTQRIVPGGMVMAICADDPEKELEYAKKLHRKIREMGYAAAGDYLCEVISELPLAAAGKEGLIYKIQVPVTKRVRNRQEGSSEKEESSF